jgi:hypothetical protein
MGVRRGGDVFAEACRRARGYTRPVLLSIQRHDGSCDSGIGAFVVINADGWMVTAWHIAKMFGAMAESCEVAQEVESQLKAIADDSTLTAKEKKKAKAAVKRPKPQAVRRCSALWGWPDVHVEVIEGVEVADLAVGRLVNFRPEYIDAYPVFKDPSRGFDVGTSLCRHGFPFHTITPQFNETTQLFELPAGSFPPPFFPIEGIYARTVNIDASGFTPVPSYGLKYLETSTPGLKGQSGGPITDRQGTVWGIQSQTRHYPLGFSPEVQDGKGRTREHQFLNVGWGVHAETVLGLFREKGIQFNLSDY